MYRPQSHFSILEISKIKSELCSCEVAEAFLIPLLTGNIPAWWWHNMMEDYVITSFNKMGQDILYGNQMYIWFDKGKAICSFNLCNRNI